MSWSSVSAVRARVVGVGKRGGVAMYRGKAWHAHVSLPIPKIAASPEGLGSRVMVARVGRFIRFRSWIF